MGEALLLTFIILLVFALLYSIYEKWGWYNGITFDLLPLIIIAMVLIIVSYIIDDIRGNHERTVNQPN